MTLTSLRCRLAGAALLAALGTPRLARADAVPSPPTDCPVGSVGNTCHGGPYCAPATCPTGGECGDGEVCEARPLCMSAVNCSGGFELPDAAVIPTPTVSGTCGGGETCEAGSDCATVMVCVPASGSSTDGPAGSSRAASSGAGGAGAGGAGTAGGAGSTVGGCSCGMVGHGYGAGAASLLALGVGALGSRRRRGSRSAGRVL